MKKVTLTGILIICHNWLPPLTVAQVSADEETRIVLDSEGWQLVGDLLLPDSEQPPPAVLLLNGAAGNRDVYKELAIQLAEKGIASLRLDLRGHGESTNLGRFIPGDSLTSDFIWNADIDVITAHQYLKSHAGIDTDRIGIVGASYSGEEMADAGRKTEYARVYVALSPGSFSEESIAAIDTSGIPWLFIVSRNERFLHEITADVQKQTRTVEIVFIPGDKHATWILEARQDVTERMAVWLARWLLN